MPTLRPYRRNSQRDIHHHVSMVTSSNPSLYQSLGLKEEAAEAQGRRKEEGGQATIARRRRRCRAGLRGNTLQTT